MCVTRVTTTNSPVIETLAYASSPAPPSKWHKTHLPPKYSPGELGKLAARCARVLARLSWTRFFHQHSHQSLKSVNPNIAAIPHPAAPYLARLARHGIPALSLDPPWTVLQQDAAMERSPHPSASQHFTDFILEDMFNYTHMDFWMVLPYSALRGHPRLCIAPAGVVPQRERRPRSTKHPCL